MDAEYKGLKHEVPFLKRLPSQYVRDNIRLTTQPIEDPTDVLKEFVALEEKWQKLVADVDRTDADAVAAILKANLYDKIDENTFGVE